MESLWKTPHNPILLLSHNGQGFMLNGKENDHTILYLYYFRKSSLHNHEPSLDESHTKET